MGTQDKYPYEDDIPPDYDAEESAEMEERWTRMEEMVGAMKMRCERAVERREVKVGRMVVNIEHEEEYGEEYEEGERSRVESGVGTPDGDGEG